MPPKALVRLKRVFASDDPTNEIGAAWGWRELLRQALATRDRHTAAHRLFRFYDACATANMPETTRLATTIETWGARIEAFLLTGVTDARTEGYNRIIKQLKRVGCGYRNQTNHERRIVLPPRTQHEHRTEQGRDVTI